MAPEEYLRLSGVEIARRVAAGELSARQVVQASLERIDAVNPGLNALTVIRREEALAEADALDERLAQARAEASVTPSGKRRASSGKKKPDTVALPEEWHLPLLGVPVVVKEEYDVTGLPTTLGGWGNTTPVTCDSEAIRRIREAGAIVVAKSTMPEFGQYTDTESERYGSTLNPWNREHSAGGSSGGSAVAVATGMVPIALAADGGGSIRIPASCCGIVGLKPARGRVSPAPLAEHWFGLVTLGAVTRTIADTARVNDVLAGSVPTDRFAAPPLLMTHEAALRPHAQTRSAGGGEEERTVPAESLPEGALLVGEGAASGERLRIVWSDRPAVMGMKTSEQVSRVLARVVEDLRSLGHHVRQTRRPWPIATIPFFVQFTAGMAVEADSVENPAALEGRTRSVAAVGRRVSERRVKAAVAQSEKIGRIIDQRFLTSADVLVLPTMPISVPKLGVVRGKNWVSALVATAPSVANTALFNVSGHPAMSIPGPVDKGELPVGIQLVCRAGSEHLLIALGQELQELYGWA